MKYTKDFEDWNDVTGALHKGGSWYHECKSILQDADKEIEGLKEEIEHLRKDILFMNNTTVIDLDKAVLTEQDLEFLQFYNKGHKK